MSSSDWYFLSGLTGTQFASGGHRALWQPTMTAIANTANDVGVMAIQVAAYANAAAGSLASQLALGTPANGIGNEPMDLPRMSMFSGGAALPWDMPAMVVNVQDATYQITEHDFGKLIIATSGTRTWTLPLGTDVWVGWRTYIRNRSGNNLTLARSGSDTINGAGSNLTIATASPIITVVCTGATAFEVA